MRDPRFVWGQRRLSSLSGKSSLTPLRCCRVDSAKSSPTPKSSLTLQRCSALCIAFHREERIRQRDRRQVGGQLRVDDEHDGHPSRLAGSERLTCEAEAVELAEILCGIARAVA